MNGKKKKAGAVLVAALVMSLVVASTSGAAKFTASFYPTTVEGLAAKGTVKFTTEAGNVECKGSGSATLSEASSTLKVTGSGSECSAFGFLSGTVNTGGCWTLMHVGSGSGDTYGVAAELECPAGAVITITSGTCKATVAPQTSSSGTLVLTNNTAGKYVEGKGNASGITYTVVEDGFGCPYSGTGVKTGATITQGSNIVAKSTNGASFDIG